MKRLASVLLAAAVGASLLTACGGSGAKTGTEAPKSSEAEASKGAEAAGEGGAESKGETKKLDSLKIAFVPSREPQEIVTATEPLKGLLQEELSKQGYEVKDVDITVGTNFEAVGEGLEAGTIDVGFIPGGTYVLYSDGAEVLLTATRDGLSIDSDDPKVWNEKKPTEATDQQVTSYRALMIAGPSEKGRAVAEKVNKGEKLSFEDLDALNWGVMSPTSPAGYIYPALWIKDNFQKNITDLSHAVQCDSYGTAFARLAQGQLDVLCTYADARRDFAEKWQSDYGMKESIWDDTDLIGVTPAIYNDTISVSKNSKIMDDGLKKALQEAFINIGKSEEGKKVIAIYSHKGYEPAKDSDYDSERAAQKAVQELGQKN